MYSETVTEVGISHNSSDIFRPEGLSKHLVDKTFDFPALNRMADTTPKKSLFSGNKPALIGSKKFASFS